MAAGWAIGLGAGAAAALPAAWALRRLAPVGRLWAWAAALAHPLLWGLAAAAAADLPHALAGCGLGTLCILAAAADLRARRIPDALTLPGAAVGLALGAWSAGPGAALGGAALFGGVQALAAVVWPGGMGWGDVKFAAAAGLLLGWRGAAAACLAAALAGGLWALGLLAWGKVRLGQTIPYGPWLALGAVVGWLWAARGPRP